MPWRRPPLPEPTITRDDVNAILGGLADIYATTLEIVRILREEDDGEEEEMDG